MRRVLVVDDDAGLLDALPETIGLRLTNVLVDACDSAHGAIERLSRIDYDAVISDIKLPVMDGLGLLAECRRWQPDTPVLLITGHGEHDLSVQALRGGAFDFIAKPIDRDYFTAALNRALDVRALRRTVVNQSRTLELHARELEEKVARRTEELQRANRAKDDFLGMISHEMRTPLTVISGGLAVLRSRGGSLSAEDWATLMDDVQRETARLSRMVEDLLVLARAESYAVIDPEPVSLARTVLRLSEALRARTGREVALCAPPDLPFAAGDLTFVERVIENLLGNAAKYSGHESLIEVTVESAGHGFLTLTVADRGPGVAPTELPLIFDNFYRASGAERAATGHGIGLAVCKRLVETMSGTIAARAREGGGMEFVVTFRTYEMPPPEGDEPVVAPPMPTTPPGISVTAH